MNPTESGSTNEISVQWPAKSKRQGEQIKSAPFWWPAIYCALWWKEMYVLSQVPGHWQDWWLSWSASIERIVVICGM